MGVVLLLYLALNLFPLDVPGLYDDEALFVNIAHRTLGHLRAGYLPSWRDLLVPFPYTGGLRALLFVPLCLLKDPSVWDVRLTNVLSGAAGLILSFLLARRFGGKSAALVATLALAVDPTLFVHVRQDYTGAGLALILNTATMAAFLRWWREGDWRFASLGSLLAGLAVWNHALSVVPVAAAAMAAAFTDLPGLQRRLRRDRRRLAWAAAAGLLGAAPFLWRALSDGFEVLYLAADPTFKHRLDARLGPDVLWKNVRLLYWTLRGTRVHDFLCGSLTSPAPTFLPWAAGLSLLYTLGRGLLGRAGAGLRWSAWTVYAAAALGVYIPPLYGSHHILLLLYPWLQIHLALAWREAAGPLRWGSPRAAAAVLGAVLLLGSNLRETLRLRRAMTEDLVHPRFSSQVWRELREVALQPARFVPVDWGFRQTVYFMTGGRNDPLDEDIARRLEDAAALSAVVERAAWEWEMRRPGTLFLLRPADNLGYWRLARHRFFEMARREGLRPRLQRRIDWLAARRTCIEVYRLRPRARPPTASVVNSSSKL